MSSEVVSIETYKAGTIGAIMTLEVPTCLRTTSFSEIMKLLSGKKWRSIHNVYVLDEKRKLQGVINLANTMQADHNLAADRIMQPITDFLRPTDFLEEAVYLAIKNDVEAVPVIDEDDHLVGAVTARMIIDILHGEHIEDALLTAGVRGNNRDILKLTTERTYLTVKSRAPWLVIGLLVGLLLGLITSWFEESLQGAIAIAYFIPVIAYVSGSVGNQTSAIAVRAMAMVKISYGNYLLKELAAGLSLGTIVGIVGGFGALLISQSGLIALSVGLSLVVASTLSSVLASFIPFIFKHFSIDPALGSGPIATAVLDVLSVVIYFFIATNLV